MYLRPQVVSLLLQTCCLLLLSAVGLGVRVYSYRSQRLFHTMSNCWEHKLRQCLDIDVHFPVAEFIKLQSEVPRPTIRRRHAELRVTLMNRLQNRTALGIQAATVASLNTPESQAAKGSCGGKKNSAESQATKGSL